LACLSWHCLTSNEQKTGGNCSWHDFASSILTSGISNLCLYSAIQLCTKHMAGFLASLESSPSPDQMEFHGNFLSKWNFLGILFGGLLVRISEYLLNGSPREVKFHNGGSKLPEYVHCFGLGDWGCCCCFEGWLDVFVVDIYFVLFEVVVIREEGVAGLGN
jgi:hypothetical protein